MAQHSCNGYVVCNYVFDQRVALFRPGHYLHHATAIYIPAFDSRGGSES